MGASSTSSASAEQLAGIVTAASVTAVWPADWLAYHALAASWTAFGALLLMFAWASHQAGGVGPHIWTAERRAAAAQCMRTWLPERAAHGWVDGCGAAVAGLAIWAVWLDPDQPVGAGVHLLAASILFGALAC